MEGVLYKFIMNRIRVDGLLDFSLYVECCQVLICNILIQTVIVMP
jgi:hypothetical protein